jgi:hypothetical protein
MYTSYNGLLKKQAHSTTQHSPPLHIETTWPVAREAHPSHAAEDRARPGRSLPHGSRLLHIAATMQAGGVAAGGGHISVASNYVIPGGTPCVRL